MRPISGRLDGRLAADCWWTTSQSEPTFALLRLLTGGWRPPVMKKKARSKTKRTTTRSVLRLLDLEHAKTAVLNSLTSRDAQRGYRHAIDEFVDWYCSEPRLALNRTVVLRYRSHLESRQLAPGTVNLRLGAVRRLAYEAADCGLLSADLAAGIRRVKGVKKLGVRLGNWLTAEQAQSLWLAPDCQRLKGKRDRALLALLLACGLRRRSRHAHAGSFAAARRTLGHRRLGWQSRPRRDSSCARLG
jgi:integrase